MKKVCVLLIVLLAVAVTGVYAGEKEFEGYLSDALCGTNGKDPAGNDLLKNPGKHTLACMKADACAASGYGIFLKEKNGMYAFHKFDAAGSDMAKKDIVDVSKKKDKIKIEIKGELQPDGTITINKIKKD